MKKQATQVPKTQQIQLRRPSIKRDTEPELISRNFISRTHQENMFEQMQSDGQVVTPPYDFAKLYQMKEDSDALTACVDAMKYNVEGFGYDIVYVGDDPDAQTSPEAMREYQQLFDFFDSINEDESYTKIAVKKREDLETLGCACYEVIRSRTIILLKFSFFLAELKIEIRSL